MLDRKKIAERRNREIASAVEYAGCDSIRALIMAGYSSHWIQNAIEAGAIIRQADGRIIVPEKESSTAGKPSANNHAQIEAEIKRHEQSEDPSLREYARMLNESIGGGREWIDEATSENLAETNEIAFQFDGLKLKNSKKAEQSGYWIYVGSRSDIEKAMVDLAEMGIEATAKQHGTKRHNSYKNEQPLWKLIFPFWFNMKLFAIDDLSVLSEGCYAGDLDRCLSLARLLGQQGVKTTVRVEGDKAELKIAS